LVFAILEPKEKKSCPLFERPLNHIIDS
jgi:hypothetical protein